MDYIKEFQESAIQMFGKPPVVTERRCFVKMATPVESDDPSLNQLSDEAFKDFPRLRGADITLVEAPLSEMALLRLKYLKREIAEKENGKPKVQGISFALNDAEVAPPAYRKLAPAFTGAQG